VASCVHQLLSLYYAYPRDPGYSSAWGHHTYPEPPPTPPRRPLTIAPPRGPTPATRPSPDSTVIPDFIALAWRAGSTTLEGLPRARPQCTLPSPPGRF